MRVAFCLLLVFLVSSCDSTDHPGYKRLDESLHFRLEVVGDESIPICAECFVSLGLEVLNSNEDLLAIKRFDRVEFGSLTFPKRMKEQLLEGSEGDSILFRATVEDFLTREWLKPISFDSSSQLLQINLKVEDVLTAEQLISIRAEERVLKDYEIQGARWMSLAIDSLDFREDEGIDGIYFREFERGEGGAPQKGQFVTVHYIARLPNGDLIDNTYIGNPLEFELGRPDQVLKGFAIGISKMRIGGKSLMLIPSSLAFGEEGSTEGIVPPYAPIIYEVELVEVGG